jgi:hypothetical protein
MKKALLPVAVFFCLLVSAPSCTKQSQDNFAPRPSSTKVVMATVAPGQLYTYNDGLSGTLSISRQALHYQLSETSIDDKNGTMLYKYIPVAGYKGSDEVTLMRTLTTAEVISNTCQSNHSRTNSVSDIITIKINVSN